MKHCVTVLVSHPTQFGQVVVGTKAGSILVIDRELATGKRQSAGESSCVRHESNLHKLEITFLSFKKSLQNDYPVNGAAGSMQATSSRSIRTIRRADQLLTGRQNSAVENEAIRASAATTKSAQFRPTATGQTSSAGHTMCSAITRTGQLIACENTLLSTTINKRTASTGELKVEFEYESHKGEIINIKFGASATNRFLTNAKDREIRLYETCESHC